MCGRYSLHANPEVVALLFGLSQVPAYAPRYNIAPTANILVVREGIERRNEAAMLRWGLVPRWAKDPAMGARMNNARSETAFEKPSFRQPWRERRCLIPASGFYEWKDEGGKRQPYYIHPRAGELFAFAGLWDQWRDLQTCAVLTTEANAPMAEVHERMPVILAPGEYGAWLHGSDAERRALMRPCPADAIAIHRVSRAVNRAANEDPSLIEPEPSEDPAG